MNPGTDRLLLSLLFALTASNQHLPLVAWSAEPTGEPVSRQVLEQMIEQYIRSHPEVILSLIHISEPTRPY